MKNLKEVKDYIVQWNEENTQEFYETEKFIWEHPELSLQEFESSAALIDLMKKNGFEVETGVAGMPTAFIATYGSGRPVIGISAEYDALPGLSQDGEKLEKCPVVPGAPGQGCGHNLLGTGGAKAAIAVKNAMEKFGLQGTVKLFGTPAEELCLGKPYMGRAGCFDGVDAFLDWHPWSYTKANYDSCQAYFSKKYHFKGRTSHGNSPWHGRSALDAGQLMGHGIDILREHIYPGNPPDAANTINYTYTATGPEFPSVVPDYTTVWVIGRFTTTEEMLDTLKRVDNCAKAGAIATETTVEEEVITVTHHKIPNKVLAERFYKNMETIGVPAFSEEEQEKAKAIQRAIGQPETGLPTELDPFEGGFTVLCDTSEYSWCAPYAAPWIAMGMQGCGWHHWGVARCAGDTMGQKSMDCAAKVISMTAADLLCQPEILEAAQAEWRERMDGRVYECLLPADQEPPLDLNRDIMEKYRK
ncbi:MAG: amidohydrolase [Firmicutes bacterium]|nr:amidohydrolase [Bacillota bacterium]